MKKILRKIEWAGGHEVQNYDYNCDSLPFGTRTFIVFKYHVVPPGKVSYATVLRNLTSTLAGMDVRRRRRSISELNTMPRMKR
jgi:hypothetical protein